MSARPNGHPTGRPRETRIRIGGFEIRKLGASRYDWRNPYHVAVSLSWPQFLLAFVLVECLINLLFGLLYVAQPRCVANLPPGSLLMAFFFSLETFATVGYGVMAPSSLYGHLVSSAEILCGVAFTAIVTGLMFARFSRPRTSLVYADRMVVAQHNGCPTLMLRVGNSSAEPLLEAMARMTALVGGTTTEGKFYLRSVELKLRRARLPIFALSWTLMHAIDESSPLAGFDAEQMTQEVPRIFVSIEGRDAILGTTVLDTRMFSGNAIAFGMRYVDTITFGRNAATLVDLTLLSALEPDVGTATGGDADFTGAADSTA